ncbi:hypothetical protein GCM10007388_15940 [Pseudoduganella plicata]|uniref:Uncharacterized protein n=1 Tax=Pseudoduganella plicata TaxID=321984 RepID=A0AA88C7W8_9BURK|nr:hypothetical protein GCM10007388_15940 [Pseudoduganella plicata]
MDAHRYADLRQAAVLAELAAATLLAWCTAFVPKAGQSEKLTGQLPSTTNRVKISHIVTIVAPGWP